MLADTEGRLYLRVPIKGQNECHVNVALILLINPLYSIFAVRSSFFKNEYTYNVLWKYNPVLGSLNFV